MLWLWELLVVLSVAVLVTLLFALAFRCSGPWASVLLFFLVVFLAAWAGGLWIRVGPTWYGVYWLGFVVVAFLVALLLAAAVPPRDMRRRRPPPSVTDESVPPPPRSSTEEIERQRKRESSLDAFLWLLLLGFVAVIVLGYIF